MFSYEERIKAVELYLMCKSCSAAIRIQGCPSKGALREWVSEYTSLGDSKTTNSKKPKYDEKQINHAVDYNLKHGKNVENTVRDLSYPNKSNLKQRLMERVPDDSTYEGFFGRFKNEMFNKREWIGVLLPEFTEILGAYMQWYARKRHKLDLNGMSPIQYRISIGLIS